MTDLAIQPYHDNDRHSVSVLAGQDRTEIAHRVFGEAVVGLERLNEELDRCFRRLEAASEGLRAVKVEAYPVLSPALQAAYGAWADHGKRETRVELPALTEAPLP